MSIEMIDGDEDLIELMRAKRKVESDYRKGRITAETYAKEMREIESDEMHMECMDSAFSDDY